MGVLVRDLGYSRRYQLLMPPAALLATTIMFNFGYMYDFTVLFLFTLGLWLMYRQAWVAYLLVFALATLNKETTLLLLLIYALYYWRRLPRLRFLVLGVAQLGVFALIQGALRYRFRNNPGSALEWHWPDQVAAYQRVLIEDTWLLVIWGLCLAVIVALMIRGWNQKPAFMRLALAPVIILVPLWFLWGYPFEIRNLMEALPVVTILMLPAPVSALVAGETTLTSAPRRSHTPL
jgi:hypothetical protein